tara:strand:+ start:54 stop:1475 length:1422 start_codon:yes stop_codon:yes gene_type:complete
MSDESMSVEADLPENYRDSGGEENCGNCVIANHENGGLYCEKFEANVESQKVCNSWTDEKIEQAETIPQESMTPVERPAAQHVTMDLDIDNATALVEAESGTTIIEIRGIAFHEGFNKNNWAISRAGVQNVVDQMVGADLTLKHPKPDGHGFSRNMDGGVEEAVVGTIKEAWVEDVPGGWNVRYIAHVVRTELFDALESGLWTRGDYGVSIGGYGVPDMESEEGIVFGTDFTFDHLAIVHRPAYPRANIESAKKKKKKKYAELEQVAELLAHRIRDVVMAPEAQPLVAEDENEDTFKYQTDSNDNHRKETLEMSEENQNEIEEDTSAHLVAEIESLKAEAVLREAAIAEFEAQEAARAEEERVALVEKASELGLKGHEDFGADTLNTMIASWEDSRPTFEAATPATTEPTEVPVEASENHAVVANYFNGVKVETREDLYERAYNAWASAWNRTLSSVEKDLRAGMFAEIKEMI